MTTSDMFSLTGQYNIYQHTMSDMKTYYKSKQLNEVTLTIDHSRKKSKEL